MSKVEILEELPRLTREERKEVLLRLAEIDGNLWLDDDDPLTDAEKALLDARLAAYERDPDAGGFRGGRARRPSPPLTPTAPRRLSRPQLTPCRRRLWMKPPHPDFASEPPPRL